MRIRWVMTMQAWSVTVIRSVQRMTVSRFMRSRPVDSPPLTIRAVSPLPNRTLIVALLALLLLVPLFLRSPLTSDTVMFDLQAKTVLQGGVLYRDILEPNFPGIVWAHLTIRSLAGWSDTAIRLADLLIVGSALTILALLVRTANSGGVSEHEDSSRAKHAAALMMLFAAVFYLTRNEWCHCQRDSWMLLPVSLAVLTHVSARRPSPRTRLTLSLLEGCLWGVAVWIKPHVIVSAAALAFVEYRHSNYRPRTLQRLGCVVLGGVCAGLPGIAWLVQTGAWSAFLDMQLNWNPEYVAAGAERRTEGRVLLLLLRMQPWWIVHFVAVPVAIHQCCRSSLTRTARRPDVTQHAEITRVALAVVYLSWLAQACLLQHAMDYIQVPPVILSIACLAGHRWRLPVVLRRTAVSAFAALAVLAMPVWRNGRLAEWPACVWSPPSWEQRDVLAQGRYPSWNDVHRVSAFLRDQQVQPGDVTCFTTHSVHIYAALGLMPPTRYVGVATLLELFPGRSETIAETVRRSGHRFVVTDVSEVTPRPGQFPWELPVVFESGSIRVHAMEAESSGVDLVTAQQAN